MESILIVTGSASIVMEDIREASALVAPRHVDWMAIGMDATDKYLWPIKYMATYHPFDIPFARAKRKAMGGNTDYQVVSIDPGKQDFVVEPIHILMPYSPPPGSSAFLGAQAGIELGYKKIILCGCPLLQLESPHNYENFQQGWIDKGAYVQGKVKSLSGWTKEFLGEPTKEWLDAE
jgi:hypothetical protein